ncbi:Hypothetical protein SRAE_X000239350 [Strongyloides ratti]|uniref:NADH dehydrogenase subunit 3 n=1 Tax=Strongyloides ratti TaxID=34506 RepID=A0A090KT38_STRRB|nr:Hypothetical protein SRAE_X000239350 [Strongyloides ratti]CEF60660.1 Hypothetical protein SRAE_X000239350 [Strongyloides ratti]
MGNDVISVNESNFVCFFLIILLVIILIEINLLCPFYLRYNIKFSVTVKLRLSYIITSFGFTF